MTRFSAARPKLLANRLLLPLVMASLLTLALAYWWLDNRRHEIFGTGLFVLLAWHLWLSRAWFKGLARGRFGIRRIIVAMLHLWLALNMAILFLTSVLISRSVTGMGPATDSITLIEIHWFSAYWVLIAVAVHVGIHWRRVMALFDGAFGLRPSKIRTAVLRLAAAALTACGVWSFIELGVMTKLTFGYSIEFWDFTASVTPFFVYWATVIAGTACVAHYLMSLRSGMTAGGSVRSRRDPS
jgi:hypothetical protein